MPNDERPSNAEIVRAARQARAEAMRDWLALLCASLLSLFGTYPLQPPLSRRQR